MPLSTWSLPRRKPALLNWPALDCQRGFNKSHDFTGIWSCESCDACPTKKTDRRWIFSIRHLACQHLQLLEASERDNGHFVTLRSTSWHFVTLRHGAHLAIQGLRGATLRRPRVFRRDMTRFAVVIVVGETPRSGDLGGSGAAVCALTCWLDRRSAIDLTRMTRMAQVASPSKVLTLRISAACRDSCSFSMEIYGNQIRWWKF